MTIARARAVTLVHFRAAAVPGKRTAATEEHWTAESPRPLGSGCLLPGSNHLLLIWSRLLRNGRRDKMNRIERKMEDGTMGRQFSIKPQHERADRWGAGGYLTQQLRMVECRVCGASNHASREGCFNCGTLLRVKGVEAREFVRVVVFGDVPDIPLGRTPRARAAQPA